MAQDNPYKPPARSKEESEQENSHQQNVRVGRRIFAHSIAFVGAVLIFIGGFIATFVIPTLISQKIASSRQWVTSLGVLGVLVGLLCAILSYRATLKTHTKVDTPR